MFSAEHTRSPGVLGVPTRAVYGHDSEGRALAAGIEMARGNPRATFVLGDRRVIAIVQGRGPFDGDVRYMRLPHRRSPAENLHLLKMFQETPWECMPFADQNVLMNALTNGQFGRTYWAKTPTTTGIANTWYDLWPVTGNPASGSIAGTAKTANIFTDTSTGAINHRGNVSSATKHFLGSGVNSTANTPWLMFYDRVLSYDQCPYVATTNETMTNTNVAARYNSGAPGCLIVWVTNTLHGATVTNITQLRYTNQAGSLLQTMPTATTVGITVSGLAPTATLGAKVIAPSTGTTPTWGFSMPMAAGDSGASLVNDYTASASNTGTFTLFLMHPFAEIPLPIAASVNELEYAFQVPELEQIFDGACISLMAYQPATTGFNVQGNMRFAWST